MTHEGFLICHDVPLARTGEQLYRPEEVPQTIKPKPGTDYVRVMRDADEVFSPAAMASLEGKDITIDHPPGLEVNPKNWRDLAHGHLQNIRRGQGAQADLMLGDLVVKSPEGIEYAQPGVQISLGYDCAYQELGADHELPSGLARQHGYIFNHAAMLDAGRCGPRCAIADHTSCNNGDKIMAKDKRSVMDQLRAAFTNKDPKTFDSAFADLSTLEGGEGDGTVTIHNHIGAPPPAAHATGDGAFARAADGAPDWFKSFATVLDTRLNTMDAKIAKATKDKKSGDDDDDDDDEEKKKKKPPFEKSGDADKDDDDDDEEKKKKKTEDEKILAALELEAPDGMTGDGIRKAVKTGDSGFLEDSFSATVAAAEILAPGIGVPTFDAKTKPASTFDAICGLRRKALDFAMREPASAALIEQVHGGRTLDTAKASCSDVRSVFYAAVALKKARNNDSSTTSTTRTGDNGGGAKKGPIKTIADLNAYNEKFRSGGLKKAG